MDAIAFCGLVLYGTVVSVASLGFTEIATKFTRSARRRLDSQVRDDELVGVTILRPLKGVDPEMEACLKSTFEQKYPPSLLEIILCVQNADDPAIEVARKLIAEYPGLDAKLMIDEAPCNYGPNPKINNLAKGYEAAKYDVLWTMDSNVWARPDTLKRSITTMLNGTHNGRSYWHWKQVKMVLHTPLAVSLDSSCLSSELDTMFLSTSHAKFYTALNTVALAPCVNGKSNIYRRSDLDTAVARYAAGVTPPMQLDGDGVSGDNRADAAYYTQKPGQAIRFFARYIGEDNMIGIALWDQCNGRAAMCGDSVVQPLGSGGSVQDYIDRRVRWLRVRKFMVMAATLVEPATESIMSGLIGTWSLHRLFGVTGWYFLLHMLIWFIIDYMQFSLLAKNVRDPPHSGFPYFILSDEVYPLTRFVPIWLTREILAFPIWVKAMAGESIEWRGQPFKILPDLTAERL